MIEKIQNEPYATYLSSALTIGRMVNVHAASKVFLELTMDKCICGIASTKRVSFMRKPSWLHKETWYREVREMTDLGL